MNRLAAHTPPAPRHGFGLIETIVGVAILTAVLLGLAQVGQFTLRVVGASNLRLRASFLAEEGLEVARLARDSSWAANIGPKALCTDHYLSFSGGSWQLTEAPVPLVDGVFDRRVRFEAVTRDASDDISGTSCVESGTDPGTRKVSVSVQWPSRGPADLIGYWSLDDADVDGVTAYDRSGQGNNGTLTNGPTPASGRIGQALEFDGGDDSVNMGSPAVLDNMSPFTFSAWFYAHSLGKTNDGGQTFGRIFSKELSVSNNTLHFLPYNGIAFFYQGSVSGCLAQKTVNAFNFNDWYFVAAIYTGTRCELYVSGNLVAQDTYQGGHQDADTPLRIGARGSNTNEFNFDGLIDEVRIYNRALSAEEIRALYLLPRPTISTYLTNLFNN